MSFDGFLNFAIPAGIFLYFAFKIYQSIQEPFDKFLLWIKEKIFNAGEETNVNRFDISYD